MDNRIIIAGAIATIILLSNKKGNTTPSTTNNNNSYWSSSMIPSGTVNNNIPSVRNRNPLNLKGTANQTFYQGQTGVRSTTDGRSFRVFSSKAYGTRAALHLLRRYITEWKQDSIYQIINGNSFHGGWSATDQNHYTNALVNWTGFSINQKLSWNKETAKRLILAMARMESGFKYINENDFNTAWNLLNPDTIGSLPISKKTNWFEPYTFPPFAGNGKVSKTLQAARGKSGVYLIRDKNKNVVYVGMTTSDLYKTVTRHFTGWSKPHTQHRVELDIWKGYEVKLFYVNKYRAREIECHYIVKYDPPLNVQKSCIDFLKENEEIPF